MELIERSNLKDRLAPGIYARLKSSAYPTRSVQPNELVTFNRLDIGMRTLYLELKGRVPKLAEKIYFEDLKAQSLGTLADPDNSGKHNFNIFRKVFDDVFASIINRGFDPDETLIPVSSSGSILDGGHRLSAALIAGKSVTCVETGLEPITCDYKYFYERDVPIEIIEMAVLQLIGLAENVFLAFLWPSGSLNFIETELAFTNVIYKKKIELTNKGAFNLLFQCYNHMDWVGSAESGYRGLQQKLVECFPRGGEVTVIAFQAPNGLSQVRDIKERVRQINAIGYSSVHITDSRKEALDIASLLFSHNGLHYLNHADPFELSHGKVLNSLRELALKQQVDVDKILIDGSWLLDLYGLRKADDLDIVALGGELDRYKLLGFPPRKKELEHHGKTEVELIFDPMNYFLLNGVKIVGFFQLMKMKKARGEAKDVIDVKLMSALIENNQWLRIKTGLNQKVLYAKILGRRKLWRAITASLNILGIYEPARRTYRKLRRLPHV